MRPRKKIKKFLALLIILSVMIFGIMNTLFHKDNELTFYYALNEKARELSNKATQNGKTYYISSNGTSDDGTDINSPMALETASKKTYYGNDKVLFKRGETFYGVCNFNVIADENNMFYLGNYGDETLELPIISGANVIKDSSVWEYYNGLYRIDLSNNDNYSEGIKDNANNIYNIAFIIDENENIYADRRMSIEDVTSNFQYCIDDKYLYFKTDRNPTEELGKLKIIPRTTLLYLSSNTVVDGLIIENAGSHGIVRRTYPMSNVYIQNCIIRNIGGAIQGDIGSTRYGNGIEFWKQAKNTVVTNCIFKNIYDAAYTLQGDDVTGGFENNICTDCIFINCSYPSEYFVYKDDSVESCTFKNNMYINNLIINQGHGYGYDFSNSQYIPANSVVWSIDTNDESGIIYKNNKSYNSKKLYFKMYTWDDEEYKKIIKSDYNIYYLNENTIAFAEGENHKEIEYLSTYNLDQNSTFNYLSDAEIEEISNPDILNSNDYNEIKAYYDAFDIKYRNSHATTELLTSLGEVLGKTEYANILQNSTINAQYEGLQNAINNLCQNIDIINSDSVSYTYECLYNLISTITSEYYNSKLANISEETLISLIEDLDNVSDKYKEIYSYYITNDNIDLTTVKNTLNNAINKYNDNLDLDIGKLETIITTAKDLYNNSITTENVSENILNKQRIINISNIANNIIDTKIAKVIEEEKSLIKVEYDKDINTPTNESITATITVGDHTTITNNGGSNKHKFDQNGTFTFELDIKGIKVSVQVTISNINKEYTIEQGYITNIVKNTQILNFKDNLGISNFTISRNGQTININEDVVATGDVLKFDNKEYVLIVCGDINSDGDCGIHDLVSYRKYLLDYAQYDNIRQKAADINQDKVLDIKDLVGIRKIVLD